MKERILEIIEYATGGSKVKFAALVGWSGQYLQNVLRVSAGIEVVKRILEMFPEINARWLILGQGKMIDNTSQTIKKVTDELSDIQTRLQGILTENCTTSAN